ncbi:LVIVD repeat-containing protein [Desmospora profundinema]|uniref:Uncharacterized protein n=1 Tax=Desmospora profundinema TaxID=1571184 RepID=A0ABU1IQA9_9BACL|nr:hypothetical protein [Desmospora profundinema]MDR6226963.1 hypothetical protein [Desmospora profundinema]
MRLWMKTGVWAVMMLIALTPMTAYACGLGPDHQNDKTKVVKPGKAWNKGKARVSAHPHYELKEIAAASPEELKGVPVTSADVYAHKGYAYVGTHRGQQSNEGVRVFDIRNPANPVEVAAFANDLPGTWQEKVIVKSVNTTHFKGDLAVVSVQKYRQDQTQNGGVLLYDVTNPEKPKKLAFWTVPEEIRTGTHELYLTVQGNRVLLLAANIYADYYTQGEYHDFSIVDVSNPTEPEELYNWNPRELLKAEDYDGYAYTDDEGARRTAFAHSIITDHKGHYAFVSYWDLGTIIVDIRDPQKPKILGNTKFERHVQGAAHSAALAKGGTLLIETREVFEPDPSDPEFERGWGYVRIYDIKDKKKPRLIGDYRSENSIRQIKAGEREPGTYTVHDPKVKGNLLYLSHYSDGVRIVNIADPTQPYEVASYVPDRAMVWGVFLHKNEILASDMGSGLKVLELNRKSQQINVH